MTAPADPEPSRPIPDSYWVIPGQFCAGEYPGTLEAAKTRAKLRRFLDAGIDCFVDLTEANELLPYVPLLNEEAAARGQTVEHVRVPVRDLSTPSEATVTRLLDLLDARLAAGRRVYLHCWGGIGRTGTIVGCYLVRHGMNQSQALAEIARLRAGTPDAHKSSPETEEQIRRVRGWRPGA